MQSGTSSRVIDPATSLTMAPRGAFRGSRLFERKVDPAIELAAGGEPTARLPLAVGDTRNAFARSDGSHDVPVV